MERTQMEVEAEIKIKQAQISLSKAQNTVTASQANLNATVAEMAVVKKILEIHRFEAELASLHASEDPKTEKKA